MHICLPIHNLVRTWLRFCLLEVCGVKACCVSVNPGAIAYPSAYFGRGSGPYHLDNVYFGRGSGPYHLDNVYCSGSESSLLSCNRRYSEIGVHNCRPGNEAGVKCASTKCVVPLCTESKCSYREYEQDLH